MEHRESALGKGSPDLRAPSAECGCCGKEDTDTVERILVSHSALLNSKTNMGIDSDKSNSEQSRNQP